MQGTARSGAYPVWRSCKVGQYQRQEGEVPHKVLRGTNLQPAGHSVRHVCARRREVDIAMRVCVAMAALAAQRRQARLRPKNTGRLQPGGACKHPQASREQRQVAARGRAHLVEGHQDHRLQQEAEGEVGGAGPAHCHLQRCLSQREGPAGREAEAGARSKARIRARSASRQDVLAEL